MNTEALRIDDLPEEIIRKILLHLPSKWLCKNAIHVCKKWHSVIDTESFWVEKGVCNKRIDRRVVGLMHNSNLFISKRLYFYRLFNRNLLKNECGHDLLKSWCILFTYVKLFNIGSLQTHIHQQNPQLPEGYKAVIEYYNMHSDESQNRAYVHYGSGVNVNNRINTNAALMLNDDVTNTSLSSLRTLEFRLGQKFQVIDLYAEGLDATIMAIKPKIYISESHATYGEGGEHCIWVTLLNSNYKVIDSYSFYDRIPDTDKKEWFEASHTFENHTNDARYIVYFHSATDLMVACYDTCFLFSMKRTKSSVRLLKTSN